MNYFEFYDLKPSWNINLEELRQKYYAKSKSLHPDYFTLSTQEEQAEMLEMTALNNKAFKTLMDRMLRIRYILQMHNVLPEEGQAKLPQDFLMQMMDLNENLMEMQFDPQLKETVQKEMKDQIEVLEAGVQNIININDMSENSLNIMVEFYLKHKYFNRLKAQIPS